MAKWCPTSWREPAGGTTPTYPDQDHLAEAVDQLASLPPLVTSWEVERLRIQLAEAAEGKRFLLQGGACAERFDQCSAKIITNKLKILLQMSLVLTFGLKRKIIRVGRFAGQYAKPRSADLEEREGVSLPSYRGELVNGSEFTPEARIPDPERMLRGHEHAAMTLNFIRSLVDGGFADLHHPEYWDLDFVHHSPRAQEYQRMVEGISDSLQFMETLAGIQASRSAVSISTPATKPCSCPTNRRKPGEFRGGTGGTTSAPTCRGSVCEQPKSTARTSSTFAASATRSASKSAPR